MCKEKEKQQELKEMLLSQQKLEMASMAGLLDNVCRQAAEFARIQGGIAVVSDFQHDHCYIHAGVFGRVLSLDEYSEGSSAFEDEVFIFVLPQDLLEQHAAELGYLALMKDIPIVEQKNYILSSLIRFKVEGRLISVLHQTRYLHTLPNRSIWIALCTYLTIGRSLDENATSFVLNLATGMPVDMDRIRKVMSDILSQREREVLSLLAQGMESKQIADALHISVNTVYRHRQNILRNLKAANTAEAIKLGLKLGFV